MQPMKQIAFPENYSHELTAKKNKITMNKYEIKYAT